MARDKEFEYRMQGLLYAYQIAEKDGVEELGREIKRRGITKMPLTVNKGEMRSAWDNLSQNMYNNITVAFLYALDNEFDFSDEDFEKLITAYKKVITDAMDLDYLGEHYVKLEDFAVEMKSKLSIDLDVNRIASTQDYYDENNKDSKYHMAKIERVIEVLENNNFIAGANFLRNKIESI